MQVNHGFSVIAFIVAIILGFLRDKMEEIGDEIGYVARIVILFAFAFSIRPSNASDISLAKVCIGVFIIGSPLMLGLGEGKKG